MSEEFTIQAARDRRTGFPVVRLSDSGPYVSLFPVTKLQAEQCIWEGGFDNPADPMATTRLIERLEQMEWQQKPDRYPESVKRLIRVPISQCTPDTLPSILATNLTLWTAREEATKPGVQYPTATSEWGRLLRWLGGSVPPYNEWLKTLNTFARFKTKDLMSGVLQQNFSWAPTVEHLLKKYLETLSESETGLPFMNLGVYELVSDTKKYDRITILPKETLWRPVAAGESAIWPTLEPREGNKWRTVLQPTLPVVTIRSWYQETQVADSRLDGQPNAFRVAAHPLHTNVKAYSSTQVKPFRARGSLDGYVTSRVTMEKRCSVCYGEVPKEIFDNDAGLRCYKELVLEKTSQSDQEDARPKRVEVQRHSNNKPPDELPKSFLESVHRDYLVLARNYPAKIRSVCLSGRTESGKTTGLLSLWGLLNYPKGSALLPKMFPQNMNFEKIDCSLLDFIKGETLINISRLIEEMWIEGILPVRTEASKRALRCPMLFNVSRRGWLRHNKRELVIAFNDIAGEMINDPETLPNNKDYPNISTTTDVIFLVPVHEIDPTIDFMAKFSAGLTSVQFKGKAINQKQINLIFAISQIDRFRHSPEADHKELLNILMKEPYTLPSNQRESELEAYCSTMVQVHYELQSWLRSKVPDLVKAAERFGSVRYCGFSAFGFQPIIEEKRPDQTVEARLPFEPQPVRAADPLLWLLRDNGLITF